MPKQTTVRLPDDLADQAEVVARVQDADFQARVKRLVERDREILDRLAE